MASRLLPLALRRAAALAILFALIGGAALAVYMPLSNAHARLDQEIADLEFRIERFQRVAAAQPALRHRLKVLESHQATEADLVPGSSDALAGADLQERAKDIITGAGGRVERVQVIPVEAENALRPVMLRVQFTGTATALQRSLHAIESGQPVLFVRALDARARSGEHKKVQQDPSLDVMLDVVMDIQGYRRVAGL